MIDWRKLRNWRLAGALWAAGTIASGQNPSGNAVLGQVVDSAHAPVAGARVDLSGGGEAALKETVSAKDGSFTFEGLAKGKYTLTAEKEGFSSRAIQLDLSPEKVLPKITVALVSKGSAAGAPNANAMEFADDPKFMIAGVTDWTAAGGHGSDVSLRTSEALNRETLQLRPAGGERSEDPSQAEDRAQEARLRKILAATPQSFEANEKLGDLYLRDGRYADALPLLQRAFEVRPSHARNEAHLAIALEETGDRVQARQQVEHALSHSDDPEVHRSAGLVFEASADPLRAVREFALAARGDPSEPNYFAWGEELLLHRAVLQAKDLFEQGVKLYPKSSRLLTSLGAALFAGAQYPQAADRLCQASDLDPRDPKPYEFMGKIEVVAPAFESCMDSHLQRYAELYPNDSLANFFYAMDLWRQQGSGLDVETRQKIESLFTKAVSLDPKCSDGFLQLGNLKASEKNYPAAVELYQKAIVADPQSSEAHYRLGLAYDRMGEREKAQQEFATHEIINKQQGAETERSRKEIKQFVVDQTKPPQALSNH